VGTVWISTKRLTRVLPKLGSRPTERNHKSLLSQKVRMTRVYMAGPTLSACFWPAFVGSSGWGAGQQLVQLIQIKRFNQVRVEACLLGTLAVLLLAVAGQGHEQGILQTKLLAQPAGYFQKEQT
jgi:hypothetical protein